jgi:hypothetical protein
MCVMSMVMEFKADEWWQRYYVPPPFLTTPPILTPLPTPAEIDEFRRLLDRAREYDKKHGEPDCELEEKRHKLRKMADELGVEIDFV